MYKNLHPVPESFAVAAQVRRVDYERMYAESLEDPDRFWGQIGRRIDWIQEFSRVKDSNFAASPWYCIETIVFIIQRALRL